MTPAARLQAAIDLLQAIDTALLPADRIVADYVRARRYIGAKDRPAIAARVFGVLRRRMRLDWWVRRVLAGLPARALPAPGRSRVIADLVLSSGIGGDDMRRLFSGEKYGPARLDKPERLLIDRLVGKNLNHVEQPPWVRVDVPKWLYHRLHGFLSAHKDGNDEPDLDLEAELAALRDKAPLDLRVNTLRSDRDKAQAALAAAGIRTEATPYSPTGLRVPDGANVAASAPFRSGLVEVQDEGAQLVALLCDARPGMRVVDFCAGAGGKTLALAAAMGGRGKLMACDTSEGRLRRSAARLKRAGAQNVERRLLVSERDKWVKRHKASFDRVLVDSPCTGVGTWRRNPDAKWSLTERDLDTLTGLQGRILDSAARLVKPGGRLIYATCSLLPEENAHRIDTFLTGPGTGWRPISPAALWPEGALTGVADGAPHLTLTPARHGTDGFFCAVLEKPQGTADGAPEGVFRDY